MLEPELLDDEGVHLGRRRSRAVLGIVLVVVVGLVVFRLASSATDSRPAPVETPRSASSPMSQAWPSDLPNGTLFVAALGLVFTIDTSSGALTRTGVQTEGKTASMTRLAEGVLIWGRSRGPNEWVLADGRSAGPVPGMLRRATSVLPGPDGLVWGTTGPGTGNRMWRLIKPDGRVTFSVRAEGSVVGDGAGGLVVTDNGGFRPLVPESGRSRQAGQIIATGPNGFVVRSCAQARCRFALRHQGDGRETELSTAVGETTTGGTLSPSDELLAMSETDGGTSTLRVSVVATGQVKKVFPTTQHTDDVVWLDNRWLALVSHDRLVLYDAANDQVVTPALPLSSIGPLSWRPS